MSLSIHDNHLLGYSVNWQTQTIVLNTEYPEAAPQPQELTNVTFVGVLAYNFTCDCSVGTILSDISERPLATVLSDYSETFESLKRFSWPVGSYYSIADLISQLENRRVRAYVISSAIGLDGFVLAEAMKIESA